MPYAGLSPLQDATSRPRLGDNLDNLLRQDWTTLCPAHQRQLEYTRLSRCLTRCQVVSNTRPRAPPTGFAHYSPVGTVAHGQREAKPGCMLRRTRVHLHVAWSALDNFRASDSRNRNVICS